MSVIASARPTRRSFLKTTAGAGTLLMLHPFSVRAQAGQAHLRLMETTDLHVHIYPYDYYADRSVDTVGLSRTGSIVRQIRAEAHNSILFDNGDFLQGNPMGDYIAYERGMAAGDMHPVIAAMNAVGIEASTLGNHEFNYGLQFLDHALAGADFPVVCANVARTMGVTPRNDDLLLPPYVILERTITDGAGATEPIRIGVIGAVPPQVMNWDRKHLEGNVKARDIVEAVAGFVPQMREEGCDIIVALSHSGIGEAYHIHGMENAAIPLAAIDGIDAVMTGHQHLVFPGPDFAGRPAVDAQAGTIHGKPATMGGFWGSHLGLIDLMLERDGNSWRVAAFETTARPIYQRQPDRSILALEKDDQAVLDSVAEAHAATLAYVRRPVGKTDAPLYSYFALVADDPSVQIVSQAQLWYVAQMLKGTEHADLPLLSAAAPFKAGGRGGADYYTDVPTGDIAIKNVADLYLYPNTIRAVRVSGAQLRAWLERSAGMFNHIEPGAQDAQLLNTAFPSFNFDVIDGVTYTIDLSQPNRFDVNGQEVRPDAARIVDLAHGNAPVTDDMEFVIATNNYRAEGGGNFPGADGSTVIFEGPDTNRDVLVRYIVEQGTVSPSADANWSFAPMPGTKVLFQTSPRAARYASDIKGIRLEPAGQSDGGFLQYRLIL